MYEGLATFSVLTTERWFRSAYDPSHGSLFNLIDSDKATRLIAGALVPTRIACVHLKLRLIQQAYRFSLSQHRSQVEMRGLEPLTSALQRRRSPN